MALQNPLSLKTDEELMALYQAGEEAAFNVIYERYSGRVYGFLKLKLRNPEGVNEVFQTAFLKLHHARMQYSPHLPFTPWLFTIARNALIDWCRQKARQDFLADSVRVEPLIPEKEPAAEPHSHALPDLTLLSEPQRDALRLRYYEEMSFEEISRRLNTSPANVRQMISRGIKRLRKTFAAEEGKHEEA
jgi:RNA polymerase sigma-70 factor (ECF subfamily)